LGSEVVPIEGGATTTVTDKSFVALPLPLSVNCTVNAAAPAAGGEPLMAPELADRVRPCGKFPFETAHVAGATAPEAAKLAEYDAPTVPPGRLAVVIVGVELLTTICKAWVSESPLSSVTLAVKWKVPLLR